MKKQHIVILPALMLSSAHGASILATPGDPAGGVGYAYHVALDPNASDTSTFEGTVGSWSWEDRRLPGTDVGWRHQSDWLAVTLSEPGNLRVQVSRADNIADEKLFPSFTLYQNFNDSADGPHVYANTGDVQWTADSQLMSYLGHLDNSSEANVDHTFTNLPAGSYTLALGGNALSEDSAVNVNYSTTLSTSPIPEPTSALLIALAGLLTLSRRR